MTLFTAPLSAIIMYVYAMLQTFQDAFCISALLILKCPRSGCKRIPATWQMEKLNHRQVNWFAKGKELFGDRAGGKNRSFLMSALILRHPDKTSIKNALPGVRILCQLRAIGYNAFGFGQGIQRFKGKSRTTILDAP